MVIGEPERQALAQRIDWLSLGFRVPRDWEIVRHSSNPARGALVFVDRRRERLRVSWTECQREPDLERLIADFTKAKGLDAVGPLSRRADGTLGFAHRVSDGHWATRSVRYHAPDRRLIELELYANDERRANELTHAVLESFSTTPEPFGLSAFGLSVAGPAGIELTHADVRPMDVRVELSVVESKLARTRVSIRKMGAADTWFSGDYRALLEQQRSADYRSFSTTAVREHDALSAQGRERGPLFQRALGQLATLQALVWRCPVDNAVFVVSSSSKARELFDLRSVRVACCASGSCSDEVQRD
jgi:catechol 2,3-dioxygenase-like lactoylglutathione lyase family enzyme